MRKKRLTIQKNEVIFLISKLFKPILIFKEFLLILYEEKKRVEEMNKMSRKLFR